MRERASGLAQSIYARIKNKAEERGQPFDELLIRFGTERVLHRLACSKHRDRFILKGALLIQHWLGVEARPTRDIDLLGPDDLSEADVVAVLEDILTGNVDEDGLVFDLESATVTPIRVGSPVLGWRAKFDGYLGRSLIRFQLDFGLGDVVEPGPVELHPEPLLDLPVATLLAYTPYNTVAEKLEAVVNLGGANSRMKDYFDLYRLGGERPFVGSVLVSTLGETFARRGTPIPDNLPEGLTAGFATQTDKALQWKAFLRRARLERWQFSLEETCAAIAEFAVPVFDAAARGVAFVATWAPGGPWRAQHGDS